MHLSLLLLLLLFVCLYASVYSHTNVYSEKEVARKACMDTHKMINDKTIFPYERSKSSFNSNSQRINQLLTESCRVAVLFFSDYPRRHIRDVKTKIWAWKRFFVFSAVSKLFQTSVGGFCCIHTPMSTAGIGPRDNCWTTVWLSWMFIHGILFLSLLLFDKQRPIVGHRPLPRPCRRGLAPPRGDFLAHKAVRQLPGWTRAWRGRGLGTAHVIVVVVDDVEKTADVLRRTVVVQQLEWVPLPSIHSVVPQKTPLLESVHN